MGHLVGLVGVVLAAVDAEAYACTLGNPCSDLCGSDSEDHTTVRNLDVAVESAMPMWS